MPMKYVILGIITIEAIYFLVGFVMYIIQRKLVFKPEAGLLPPDEYGLSELNTHELTTDDGEHIECWYHPPVNGEKIILYFHGNKFNLGDDVRVAHFRSFLDKGFGLCVISFRGYGNSSGTPTEEGFYHDARAALKFLKVNKIKQSQIILFGESLGTGVATKMAEENPKIKYVALEAPYTSVCNVAASRHPYLPVHMLMKDHFNSIGRIKTIHANLIIFHGNNDKTIPVTHGKQLYEAANEPKEIILFDDVDHIDFPTDAIADHLAEISAK